MNTGTWIPKKNHTPKHKHVPLKNDYRCTLLHIVSVTIHSYERKQRERERVEWIKLCRSIITQGKNIPNKFFIQQKRLIDFSLDTWFVVANKSGRRVCLLVNGLKHIFVLWIRCCFPIFVVIIVIRVYFFFICQTRIDRSVWPKHQNGNKQYIEWIFYTCRQFLWMDINFVR